MSSRPDTYRILVAGDEELGFSFCAKLLDTSLQDPRSIAKESLAEMWPKDEWTKHTTISKNGKITTLEIDLELHGAWVWEIYNTLEPKDYYKRFSGLIHCANPTREHLGSELSNFIESVYIHIGCPIPTIIIVDRSIKLVKGQTDSLRQLAESLVVPIFFIKLNTGENIETAFKSIADEIYMKETS
ncbi:hypothetical protein E4H12_08070 [Candidatus Thorarchaeota archaeon]|nr:MAG: hypothetical protein E4H12_08070 [Candidatus Thorarchaeota archaeon]